MADCSFSVPSTIFLPWVNAFSLDIQPTFNTWLNLHVLLFVHEYFSPVQQLPHEHLLAIFGNDWPRYKLPFALGHFTSLTTIVDLKVTPMFWFPRLLFNCRLLFSVIYSRGVAYKRVPEDRDSAEVVIYERLKIFVDTRCNLYTQTLMDDESAQTSLIFCILARSWILKNCCFGSIFYIDDYFKNCN